MPLLLLLQQQQEQHLKSNTSECNTETQAVQLRCPFDYLLPSVKIF
jgi:hypothetical protein